MLAESNILQYFPDNDLAKLLGWAIGLMLLTLLVLGVIKALEDRFKKKPPIDETLRELSKSLAGLAPNEKVEALIAQLAHFVTRPELDLIRDQLSNAASRVELESLRTDLHNQLVEIRAYVHEGIHDIKGEINSIRLQNIDERTGVHNRLNVITEVLFELRGETRARRLGGVPV